VSKKDVDSVEVIKLVKDFNGLGISFEDDHSSGVRVRSLSANSPASRDGRLVYTVLQYIVGDALT